MVIFIHFFIALLVSSIKGQLCSIKNCQYCNTAVDYQNCWQCADGYGLVNNNLECIKCDAGCMSCMDVSYKCDLCVDGSYLDEDFSCKKCQADCKSCSKDDPTICVECSEGYGLYGGKCLDCIQGCLVCDRSIKECSQCSDSYYLTNSKCELKCSTDSNCLLCIETPTTCTSCIEGFYLKQSTCNPCQWECKSCFSSGTCDSCPVERTFLNGQCLCASGYYSDSTERSCIQCDWQCQKCIALNTCILCTIKETTLENGVCKCEPGLYPDPITKKCQKCNAACVTCFAGDDRSCNSCPPGKVLGSNVCLNLSEISKASKNRISISDDFYIYYKILDTQIEFEFISKTTPGWVGFGFGQQMIGSDAFICTIKDEAPYAKDLILKNKYTLESDTQTPGMMSNVYITKATPTTTGVSYVVRRDLRPTDINDFKITEEAETNIIWALGDNYELFYHGIKRGTKKIRFSRNLVCDETCLTCSGPEKFNCLTCRPDYFLYNATKNQSYCSQCNFDCNTCFGPDSSSCLSCVDVQNKVLINNKCVWKYMIKLNNNTLSLKDSIQFLNDSNSLNDLSDYVGKVTEMLYDSIIEESISKNETNTIFYFRYGNNYCLDVKDCDSIGRQSCIKNRCICKKNYTGYRCEMHAPQGEERNMFIDSVLNRIDTISASEEKAGVPYNYRALTSLMLGISRLKDGFSNTTLSRLKNYVDKTMASIYNSGSADTVDFAVPALWRLIDIATFFVPTNSPEDDIIKKEFSGVCNKWMRNLLLLKLKFIGSNLNITTNECEILMLKIKREEISILTDFLGFGKSSKDSQIKLLPGFYENLLLNYNDNHFFAIHRKQKSNPYELINNDDLIASENLGLEIFDMNLKPIKIETEFPLIYIILNKKLQKKIENIYNKMFCSFYNSAANLWVSNGMTYISEDDEYFYCNSTVFGEFALNVRNLEELFGYKRGIEWDTSENYGFGFIIAMLVTFFVISIIIPLTTKTTKIVKKNTLEPMMTEGVKESQPTESMANNLSIMKKSHKKKKHSQNILDSSRMNRSNRESSLKNLMSIDAKKKIPTEVEPIQQTENPVDEEANIKSNEMIEVADGELGQRSRVTIGVLKSEYQIRDSEAVLLDTKDEGLKIPHKKPDMTDSFDHGQDSELSFSSEESSDFGSEHEFELFNSLEEKYSLWNLHSIISIHKTYDSALKIQKFSLLFLHFFMQQMILSICFDVYEVDRQTELQLIFERIPADLATFYIFITLIISWACCYIYGYIARKTRKYSQKSDVWKIKISYYMFVLLYFTIVGLVISWKMSTVTRENSKYWLACCFITFVIDLIVFETFTVGVMLLVEKYQGKKLERLMNILCFRGYIHKKKQFNIIMKDV